MLAKSAFEYHLETLTNRKEEYEFEHFCRKLAEKEICPNLTVQTGPTGGGDSKADAETYPVARDISERWWVGSSAAGSERWAFAFSAKRRWKSKLISDVEKIATTGRGYTVITFITNQFVSDRAKAELQDELSESTGSRVVIHDRAWIVERVYANGHLAMAIDALAIEGAQAEAVRKFGPNDAARAAELAELDKQIADPTRYQEARFQLAEDCLRSAILARGLERPQAEVEARFEQAERIAEEVGHSHQGMRIKYARAWTAYWWFEDLDRFDKSYDEVEQRLKGTVQASDLERLSTLWQTLFGGVVHGRLTAKQAKLEKRRKRLVGMLKPLADDSARPNNALEAQVYLTMIDTSLAMRARDTTAIDKSWREWSRILKESKPLGNFPVSLLESFIPELGRLVDSPEYDALYDQLVDIIRQRRSDGAAGEAYVERGLQKLDHGKPYEGIRWFGRAEELLLKREYRDELVKALLCSNAAYTMAGLHWAARNRALAALAQSMLDLQEDGSLEWPQWLSVKRLVWSELTLGRIPQAIAALKLARIVVSAMQPEGDLAKEVEDELVAQEGFLGLLLLNLKPSELDPIAKLHDGLERDGLYLAAMATLFSLGQTEALRVEGYCPTTDTDDDIAAFLSAWLAQPGAKQIPEQSLLLEGATTSFRSIILGCKIAVEAETNPVSVGIAESVLGGLEALLATSNEADLFPHKEALRIHVHASDSCKGAPKYAFAEGSGATTVEIVHPPNFRQTSANAMQAYRDWLQEVMVAIICHVAVVRDPKDWLEKVAGEERGFARALAFGDMLTINDNVFGPKPPIRIQDHIPKGVRVFAPLRTEPLLFRTLPSKNIEPRTFGSGAPQSGFSDPEDMKHTDRRVLSPIESDLWNRAGWHGAFFAIDPSMPGPLLGLTFRDQSMARRIFGDWIQRWGQENSDEHLRLAIITGVTQEHPFAYSMSIGPTFGTKHEANETTFTTVSRLLRMDATTPDNLNNFLKAYQAAGSFGFLPAVAIPGEAFPELQFDLILPRRKIDIRAAWQVGENDPDQMVLQDDDDPFIPADQPDAPVVKALERVRAFRRLARLGGTEPNATAPPRKRPE